MQTHGTMANLAAPMSAGKTEPLRHRLEELSASGFIPRQIRQNLQQLLMRIDLSASSPFAVELCYELWVSVGKQLESIRHEVILPPHVDRELQRMIYLFCEAEIASRQSLMIQSCLICREGHKLNKSNIVLTKPDAWFYMSPADIANRCEGNEQFLSIDMRRFFIRGVLPLKYLDSKINVEMWAEVDKVEFSRFIDRFLSGLREKASSHVLRLKGALANRMLHNLLDCDESVEIVCDGQSAPEFCINDESKALFRAQQQGLTQEMFAELFSSFAHSQAIHEKRTRISGDGIPLNVASA